MKFTTYYVLNSLLNGERGVTAVPSESGLDKPLADGHYYLLEGEVDGHGPYDSVDDAREAAESMASSEWWDFVSGQLPRPMRVTQTSTGDLAKITRLSESVFKCELQDSYETLTIEVSAKDHAHAARVFSGALLQMEV